MTRDLRRRRGEPLVAMLVLLGLWIGGRVGLGGSVFLPERLEAQVSGLPKAVAARQAAPERLMPTAIPTTIGHLSQSTTVRSAPRAARMMPALPTGVSQPSGAVAAIPASAFAARPTTARPILAPPPFAQAARPKADMPSRWSADAWVLVRRSGGSGLGAGLSPATYGASQAGAVLRYRLAPASVYRPTIYLRASRSLDGPAQSEAAVGVSARPIPQVPIVAAGEVRAFHDAFGTRLRPVALAISEFSPVELPHGLRGEAYVQAGYAGGKGATAFADGQVRLDRSVLRAGPADLRLGAGAWGGAQKGAARLDAGPSLSATLPVGNRVFARASIDWRFRLAGDAAPGSGPALTVSAGF